jgi:hypothetical protein
LSDVEEAFSDQLERWLGSDDPKTLGTMGDVFAEKSFAVTILLLMFVPALPLPTGGITHVFEVIVVVLSAQMIIGRPTIWLPERWQKRELGKTLTGKAIPFILRRVRWFEKYSKPRGAALINRRWFIRIVGLELMVFAISAAVAPPFSGLDTLPSLGAVIVCLALVLEDLAIYVAGTAVGLAGIALIVTIGAALAHLVGDHI